LGGAMKSMAIRNISFFDGEEIVFNKNIIIRKKTITISETIPNEDNIKIIDGSTYIAIPSLPLIKENVFDIFSYRYLHNFSDNFILNGELFDKLPYNYLEVAAEILAEKMILNGDYFLFMNHLCYNMIKSSLMTVSMRLKNTAIKSSLSYLYNDVHPEQKMVAEKENSSYKEYVGNLKDPYLFHHDGYYLNKKHALEDSKVIYLRFPAPTDLKLEDFIYPEDMEKTFIIKFEDSSSYISNYIKKPNIYYIIEDDVFSNPSISNFVFSQIDSKVDSHFIIANGFQSYGLLNSILKISNLTKDVRVLNLLKNQLIILPQFIYDITERKLGYIKNDFEANLLLLETKSFSIQSFDDLLDLIFIKYLSSGIPSLRIIEGEII